jgi:hypothetical protein
MESGARKWSVAMSKTGPFLRSSKGYIPFPAMAHAARDEDRDEADN